MKIYLKFLLVATLLLQILLPVSTVKASTEGYPPSPGQTENVLTIQSLSQTYNIPETALIQQLNKGYSLNELQAALQAHTQSGQKLEDILHQLNPEVKTRLQQLNYSPEKPVDDAVTAQVYEEPPFDFNSVDWSTYKPLPAISDTIFSEPDPFDPTVLNSTYQQKAMNALSSTMYPSTYDQLAIKRLQVQTDTAPFSLSAGSENISTISGGLDLKATDLVLPGRKGLSFALTRHYNSADSVYYDKYVYTGAVTTQKYYLGLNARLYTTNPYQLAQYGSASSFSNDPVFGHFSFVQYLGWSDQWPYPFNYYTETQEFDNQVRDSLQASYPYVDPNNINSPSLFSKLYLVNGTYLEAKAYTTGNVYTAPNFTPTQVGTAYANKTKAFPNENRFPIGKGWSWDIPYLEFKDNKKYLHMSGGSTYEFTGYGNYTLVGYPWSDLSLSLDYSTVQVNGQTSYYVLTSIQGQKQYFNSIGQLIQIEDLFGNTVQFEYGNVSPYGTVLTKVRDALGNEINITYSTTQVTLTLGDRTVVYVKTLDPQGNKELLSQVTDPEGRKTLYEYNIASTAFDLVASGTRKDNFAALLTEVHHPTKARTVYTYTPFDRVIGTFARETEYRVTAREDVVSYVGSPDTKANRVTYSYSGDGAGVINGPSDIFSTTVHDGRMQTTYTYDKVRVNDDTPYVFYNTSVAQQDGVQTTTHTMEYNRTNRWPTPTKTTTQTVRGADQSVAVITQKSYDAYGNVTSETDPNNVVTSYGYDSSTHLLSQVTQPINNSGLTAYTEIERYPGTNAVQQVRVKENNTGGTLKSQVTYAYDAYGNATATTLKDDNRDIVVSTAYDSLYSAGFPTGQSIQVTNANNQTSTITQSFQYKKWTGERTKAIDGKGYVTDYEYDKLGRLTQVKHPDLSTVTVTHDDANNKLTVVDETGVTALTEWNPFGWKVSTGLIGKAKQTFGYDAYGRVDWSKDGTGNQTNFTYDNRNRLKTTVSPGSATATMTYDDVLRIVTETDAEGNKTISTSDVLGRVVLQERFNATGARMSSNEYTHDYVGNITTLKDGKANEAGGLQTTQYAYDVLSRLTSVTDAELHTIRYTYSLASLVTQIEYPDQSKVLKQYDQMGRLIRKTDPSNQIETYGYDANSNLQTVIDREGKTRTYGYNSRSQQTSSVMADETITAEYDAAGKRQWMQDNTGRTNYTYDPATGWLSTVQYPDQRTVQYQYDNAGKRSQMIDPFGVVTHYQYDARNRLEAVGPAVNNWDVTYTYKANSLPYQRFYRNGITSTSAYNEYNLTDLTHAKPGSAISSHSYGYDLHRNQTSKTEHGTGYTFGYDSLNRIETSSQFNEEYAYDSRGNRSWLKSGKPFNLTDANYQYDSRSRLTGANTDQGANVTYRYNGDSLLVERTENGSTTRYYYDGADIIAEGTVSSGVVTHKASYIRGKQLVARVDGNGSKAYYIHNGHGDVIGLTDGAGNVLNEYTYDIWGNPLRQQESVPNPFRYSGELWDSSTNLQYLRARWYDPNMGRFLNEDTYEGESTNPLSLNLYTYVSNNPVFCFLRGEFKNMGNSSNRHKRPASELRTKLAFYNGS